ncbi:MAG: quinone-dependent dihydroorotate dehydrogenase [Chloroflexota bacterium]
MYQSSIFPLVSRLDAETAHAYTLSLLSVAQRWRPGRWLLRRIAGPIPCRPVQLFGLTFPNVLGVAAGFDKDARVVTGLACLGFGHVEVGTLTPRRQPGNPRPRLFRLPSDQALINRLGFPNEGAAAAIFRLKSCGDWGIGGLEKEKSPNPPIPTSFIIGVSLGKQKETPLAEAAADYAAVMRAVYPYADYLAVNVSSPNTPGLRELQSGLYLADLLQTLMAENETLAVQNGIRPRPLLLKIAPDLTWAELDEILSQALTHRVSGLIAANTTLARQGLRHPLQKESGGLSGRPLAQRSNEMIATITRQVGDQLPVIGVGGIFTAADAQAKLDAGARLLQLYTGLVYQGPGLAGQILRQLAIGNW